MPEPISSSFRPSAPVEGRIHGEVERLRALVAERATSEGRTDSLYPGLRYYRFSTPAECIKTQRLMPGLVVVLQGRKTVALVGRSLSYDPLHCLVLAKETICHSTVVQADPNHPYLAIHLDLPPDILVKTLVALGDAKSPAASGDVPGVCVSPVDPRVLQAMERLLPATDAAADRRLIAPLVIEEIVVRLLQSSAAREIQHAAAMSRHAARIQGALQFMRDHFAQALTVDELARQAAMSPSHVAHRFREIAGVSPMRFLRDVRLEQARTLMLTGQVRPSEAAVQVGFASAAHFAREFKSRFDATPTDYVRRMRVP